MNEKRHQQTLAQRVLHFIQKEHLVSTPSCLLVAVSGGPDSVCLLHILAELREKLRITLHIAHLNHKLRGAESEADARYVSELAHHLGIPATTEERDVKAYQARQHISLEEAAREVRYTFLSQVAQAIRAEEAAAGHTADDHTETILMHLVRGTGIKGLQGLKPRTQWQLAGNSITIVRPLLQISREETAEYCRQHHLAPRIDTSNLSLSPLRNRIRHQLLPLLKSYNPQVAEALQRTARIASDDLGFIDQQCLQLWAEIAQKQGNAIIIDKQRLLKSPSVLRRYLLRMSIEKLVGNIKDIEMRHIEDIMSILTKPAGKRLDLPGGLIFAVEYDRYLLTQDQESLSPFPPLEDELPLKLPGEMLLPGWRIEANIINREQMTEKDDFTAHLDLDKAGGKLAVRSRQRGDRFQPLGMSQPKKLGEFMIDAKIPQAWRGRIPIVCSQKHILWVVGWRIDDRVKVTKQTKRVLCLKFERC